MALLHVTHRPARLWGVHRRLCNAHSRHICRRGLGRRAGRLPKSGGGDARPRRGHQRPAGEVWCLRPAFSTKVLKKLASRTQGYSVACRVFVVGKDMRSKVAYVARGRHHPALYSARASLQPAHWIAGQPPAQLAETGSLVCSYKARYRQPARSCTVHAAEGDAFEPSRFCRLAGDVDAPEAAPLHVSFDAPARAVTPQQAFVMYDGEVCLGSAPVLQPGRTLFETGAGLDAAAQAAADCVEDEVPCAA